jgi:hypothetical protein
VGSQSKIECSEVGYGAQAEDKRVFAVSGTIDMNNSDYGVRQKIDAGISARRDVRVLDQEERPNPLALPRDGNLEIDNNDAERSLRGITPSVGRTACPLGYGQGLFFGSDNGGRTAAILTSFIATCKRLEINPFMYFRDIFQLIRAHPVNYRHRPLCSCAIRIRYKRTLETQWSL